MALPVAEAVACKGLRPLRRQLRRGGCAHDQRLILATGGAEALDHIGRDPKPLKLRGEVIEGVAIHQPGMNRCADLVGDSAGQQPPETLGRLGAATGHACHNLIAGKVRLDVEPDPIEEGEKLSQSSSGVGFSGSRSWRWPALRPSPALAWCCWAPGIWGQASCNWSAYMS